MRSLRKAFFQIIRETRDATESSRVRVERLAALFHEFGERSRWTEDVRPLAQVIDFCLEILEMDDRELASLLRTGVSPRARSAQIGRVAC